MKKIFSVLFLATAAICAPKYNAWQSINSFDRHSSIRVLAPTPTPVPPTPTPTPSAYAETNADPNVIFLLKYNETTGNLVDTIIPRTMTARNVTSTTYSVNDTSGLFTGVANGVSSSGAFTRFGQNGSDAALALGTLDFVIEAYVYPSTSSALEMVIFQAADNTTGGTLRGYDLAFRRFDAGNDYVQLTLQDNSDNVVSAQWIVAGMLLPSGTNPKKIRIKGVRAGVATCYVDGVSQGTVAISTVSASIPAFDVHTFLRSTASGQLIGTMYTLRIVSGNSTANLGGPGGG